MINQHSRVCTLLVVYHHLMANAKAQYELVGVLVNLYPRLTVRLAEVTGAECPPYERVSAGPNTHQVRKEGKRGQVASDGTVHLLTEDKKCHFFQVLHSLFLAL